MRKTFLLGALCLAAASCTTAAAPRQATRHRGVARRAGFAPDKRVPITFDYSAAAEFTVDLAMRNYDGSVRTSFTGPNAWVRLSFAPAGKVVESSGPKGKDDPDVAGSNVHLTNGEAKGIKIRVVGAYGDTRLVAEDVGFAPTTPGKLSACSNGVDDDSNGYADWPNDPNCLFLNDDSEAPFDRRSGMSAPLYFANPMIHDVQERHCVAVPRQAGRPPGQRSEPPGGDGDLQQRHVRHRHRRPRAGPTPSSSSRSARRTAWMRATRSRASPATSPTSSAARSSARPATPTNGGSIRSRAAPARSLTSRRSTAASRASSSRWRPSSPRS